MPALIFLSQILFKHFNLRYSFLRFSLNFFCCFSSFEVFFQNHSFSSFILSEILDKQNMTFFLDLGAQKMSTILTQLCPLGFFLPIDHRSVGTIQQNVWIFDHKFRNEKKFLWKKAFFSYSTINLSLNELKTSNKLHFSKPRAVTLVCVFLKKVGWTLWDNLSISLKS